MRKVARLAKHLLPEACSARLRTRTPVLQRQNPVCLEILRLPPIPILEGQPWARLNRNSNNKALLYLATHLQRQYKPSKLLICSELRLRTNLNRPPRAPAFSAPLNLKHSRPKPQEGFLAQAMQPASQTQEQRRARPRGRGRQQERAVVCLALPLRRNLLLVPPGTRYSANPLNNVRGSCKFWFSGPLPLCGCEILIRLFPAVEPVNRPRRSPVPLVSPSSSSSSNNNNSLLWASAVL